MLRPKYRTTAFKQYQNAGLNKSSHKQIKKTDRLQIFFACQVEHPVDSDASMAELA